MPSDDLTPLRMDGSRLRDISGAIHLWHPGLTIDITDEQKN
jgi:hypothetical protein